MTLGDGKNKTNLKALITTPIKQNANARRFWEFLLTRGRDFSFCKLLSAWFASAYRPLSSGIR
jgi:hypothetical protein